MNNKLSLYKNRGNMRFRRVAIKKRADHQNVFQSSNISGKQKRKSKNSILLKIGQPGDKYEQEADRVAERVVSMSESQAGETGAVSKLSSDVGIRRACAECEQEIRRQPEEEEESELRRQPEEKEEGEVRRQVDEEEEEGALSAKEISGQTPTVTPKVQANINSMRGNGKPLPKSVRAFFEPRFGYDFSEVRIHTDACAVETAHAVNSKAFTTGRNVVFGAGQYSPDTSEGKKLLAHELAHVVQQKVDGSHYIQRNLALTPPNPDVAEPALSDAEIRDAIDFNNRRYQPDVIRLIQDVVGARVTGTMDEDTIRLIALIQAQFDLADVDGKVGPDTFDLLVSELSAENAPTDTCMTMFRIRGPRTPMDLRVAGPGLANIFSRFNVEARFSPRCNCSEFEYRQFICGTVNRTRAGVVTNINHLFAIPGGGLPVCPGWVQDGNTTEPQNGRYGHRNHAARANSRYLDDSGSVDMGNGCVFQAFDVPGLWEMPDVSGDQYDFDMRFFGDIRRGGRRMERKFWALRDTVTIP
jgi:hypothetical protein